MPQQGPYELDPNQHEIEARSNDSELGPTETDPYHTGRERADAAPDAHDRAARTRLVEGDALTESDADNGKTEDQVYEQLAAAYAAQRQVVVIGNWAGAADDVIAASIAQQFHDQQYRATTTVTGDVSAQQAAATFAAMAKRSATRLAPDDLARELARDIPIYQGSDALQQPAKEDNFFGRNGFGDQEGFPGAPDETRIVRERSVAEVMADTLQGLRAGEVLRIYCGGPLTDVAALVRTAEARHLPLDRLELVMMAGNMIPAAYRPAIEGAQPMTAETAQYLQQHYWGNTGFALGGTPLPEFNINYDPASAAKLFARASDPTKPSPLLYVIPWDATKTEHGGSIPSTAIHSWARQSALGHEYFDLALARARAIVEGNAADGGEKQDQATGDYLLCDLNMVVAMINPEAVHFEDQLVEVSTASPAPGITYTRPVPDGQSSRIKVATDFDRERLVSTIAVVLFAPATGYKEQHTRA